MNSGGFLSRGEGSCWRTIQLGRPWCVCFLKITEMTTVWAEVIRDARMQKHNSETQMNVNQGGCLKKKEKKKTWHGEVRNLQRLLCPQCARCPGLLSTLDSSWHEAVGRMCAFM